MIYTYDVRVTTGRDQARKTPRGKAEGAGGAASPDCIVLEYNSTLQRREPGKQLRQSFPQALSPLLLPPSALLSSSLLGHMAAHRLYPPGTPGSSPTAIYAWGHTPRHSPSVTAARCCWTHSHRHAPMVRMSPPAPHARLPLRWPSDGVSSTPQLLQCSLALRSSSSNASVSKEGL